MFQRALQGLNLGYTTGSGVQGFILYLMRTKRIIVTRNVSFDAMFFPCRPHGTQRIHTHPGDKIPRSIIIGVDAETQESVIHLVAHTPESPLILVPKDNGTVHTSDGTTVTDDNIMLEEQTQTQTNDNIVMEAQTQTQTNNNIELS